MSLPTWDGSSEAGSLMGGLITLPPAVLNCYMRGSETNQLINISLELMGTSQPDSSDFRNLLCALTKGWQIFNLCYPEY